VLAQQYTLPASGRLRHVDLYAGDHAGQLRAGVYADAAGEPGALLAGSEAQSVDDARAWIRFTLDSPLEVTEGQRVWLAGHAAIEIRSDSETVANSARRYSTTPQAFASGLPDPFPVGGSYADTRVRGMRARLGVFPFSQDPQ